MPKGIYERKEIIKKGDRFGRLTAIVFVERKSSVQYWMFECDCGKKKIASVNNVKMGNTKSCGCLYNEEKNAIKHGMEGTRTYKSWAMMKCRCLNKNYTQYKDYGGRGITICKEWLIFENFYRDMGKRPEGMSIDRIDNNGNYCKSNCKWSTPKEQNNNRNI